VTDTQQVLPEQLLTPAQVAALVFVDPKTVSRWASRGHIACTRTQGGHRRFRLADVEPFLPRDRRVEPMVASSEAARMDMNVQAARRVARVADEAAVQMRSRAAVQRRRLDETFEQAKELVRAVDAGDPIGARAAQLAATIQAVATATSTESSRAAVRVARAVADAAVLVAASSAASKKV
jgi:excisionase family DNA binding protein